MDRLSDSADEIRLGLLKDIELVNQRIEEQNKLAAVVGAEQRKRLEKQIERERERLKLLQKQVEPLEEQYNLAEDYEELQNSLEKSFTKLDSGARKLITTNKVGGTAFASLAKDILDLKEEQFGLSDDELKVNQKKLEVYSNLYTSITSQADAVSQTKSDLLGQTEAANRRFKFEESIANLGDAEKKKLTDLFNLNENLIQQQERLQQIQEESDDLYKKLPTFLQDAVDMTKKLGKSLSTGMLPLVLMGALLAAALDTFTELSAAAKKFREDTGLTASQSKELDNQVKNIRNKFSELGLEANDVYDTIGALKGEFADNARLSDAVVSSMTVLNKNFGIAQKDAAKVAMIMQSMAGYSAETAQGLEQQIANMANVAGVAPAKVFADIAEAAEDTYTYFKGDINAIAKQAVEARRLGTTLKDVLKTTESLLDFENGIEKELVAATFVGGQFNLSQARALEYAGKHVDAQKEILRQVERTGRFADKDMFTKRVLADAAGMTVEQITKQLQIQKLLSGLSDE
jgi:DNA repair exonuclease SbcCD ATPase subunit